MNNRDKLTPNFSLGEFTASEAAGRIGSDNMPNATELRNLKYTALQMEIVRVLLGGKPVTITSAFRNEEVNEIVGGVKNSDHRNGFAVDFRRHGLSGLKICQLIARSAINFDQIIDYNNGRIHMGFGKRNRKQGLTVKGGRYIPTNFN